MKKLFKFNIIKLKSLAIILYCLIFINGFSQNWQLVKSELPGSEPFVAAYNVKDYGITGNGLTDVTQQFQNLLTQLGNLGGGTLFVPEGKYAIKGTLLIPKGITLRGEWKKPEKGEPVAGTILMAYAGRGNENATPFITMEPSAAVMEIGRASCRGRV